MYFLLYMFEDVCVSFVFSYMDGAQRGAHGAPWAPTLIFLSDSIFQWLLKYFFDWLRIWLCTIFFWLVSYVLSDCVFLDCIHFWLIAYVLIDFVFQIFFTYFTKFVVWFSIIFEHRKNNKTWQQIAKLSHSKDPFKRRGHVCKEKPKKSKEIHCF